MRETGTKRAQHRKIAIAMLMLATTAGATAAGIAAASAAEPARFEATAVPNKDNTGVSGNGIASTRDEAKGLAENGVKGLCALSNFMNVTNITVTGESTAPDGNIVYSVAGTCIEYIAPNDSSDEQRG